MTMPKCKEAWEMRLSSGRVAAQTNRAVQVRKGVLRALGLSLARLPFGCQGAVFARRPVPSAFPTCERTRDGEAGLRALQGSVTSEGRQPVFSCSKWFSGIFFSSLSKYSLSWGKRSV